MLVHGQHQLLGHHIIPTFILSLVKVILPLYTSIHTVLYNNSTYTCTCIRVYNCVGLSDDESVSGVSVSIYASNEELYDELTGSANDLTSSQLKVDYSGARSRTKSLPLVAARQKDHVSSGSALASAKGSRTLQRTQSKYKVWCEFTLLVLVCSISR